MTVRLHHVAVTVTDMDASIAWYKDLFGFEELVRDEHSGGSGGYAVVLGPPDWSMFVVLNHHPTNGGARPQAPASEPSPVGSRTKSYEHRASASPIRTRLTMSESLTAPTTSESM